MLVLLVFISALFPGSCLSGYSCPGDCRCATLDYNTTDKVQLVCNVPTIHESTPFSLIPGPMTTVLTILCEPYIISEINQTAFSHLDELEELSLLSCAFLDLPTNLFSSQTNLRSLIIGSPAQYLTIPKGFFKPLINLRELSIYGNVKKIQPGALCGLNYLEYLHFYLNAFTDMNNVGIIDSENNTCLPSLKHLDLSLNHLMNIEYHMQKSAPNLNRLYINNNNLSRLPCVTTKGLTKLQVLNAGHNKITHIIGCEFDDLENLLELSLANNSLTHVPDKMFLPQLLHLDLSDNELASIGVVSDESITLKLLSLDLSNNNLDLLPIDILDRAPSLQYLNLTGNRIRSIPSHAFQNMMDLKYLNLSSNKLSELFANNFVDLHSLTHLDLSSNQISSIDTQTWITIPTIQFLSLANNFLDEFSAGFQILSQLQHLDLSYNRIHEIKQSDFKGLINLRNLLISDNDIEYLPFEVFSQLLNLFLLNLNRNKISNIEYAAFKNCRQLKHIALNENNITDIDIIFYQHVPQLNTLWLKANKLYRITKSLFPSELTTIDLSYNEIYDIEQFSFNDLPYLTSVDLRFNNMRAVHKNAFATKTLTFRPNFDIAYNQWECTCATNYFKFINTPAYKDYAYISDLTKVICVTHFGKTKFVADVKEDDFLCDYKNDCDASKCNCCFDLYFGCECTRSCPNNCTCVKNLDKTFNLVNCSKRGYYTIPPKMPTTATTLDLSGNSLSLINNTFLSDMEYLHLLYLNNCDILSIEPKSFEKLVLLEHLDLSHNNLTVLKAGTFHNLIQLQRLYLNNNGIENIHEDTFSSLSNLEVLRLSINKIAFIDLNEVLKPLTSLQEVYLSDNPIDCSCESGMMFKTQVIEHSNLIKDSKSIMCYDVPEQMISTNDSSEIISNDNTPLLNVDYTPCLNISERVRLVHSLSTVQKVTVGIFVIILFIIIVICCLIAYYRHLIQVWLYAKYGISFGKRTCDAEEKRYDAFVSFSERDKDFVLKELMVKLEEGDIPFRLCIHYRDWLVGESISTNIVNSINNSQRTILVLSDNFLYSEWCNYEFQTAHHRALKDKNKHLIIILLQDNPPENLDPDLQLYISTHTYLKYNDPWFWKKMLYAMPRLSDEEKTDRLIHQTEEQMILKKQKAKMKELTMKYNNGKIVSV